MLNGYPRPQLERKEWLNLNGEWQFLFDDEKSCDLGLTPDHEQSMAEEGKTGFNPFYRP